MKKVFLSALALVMFGSFAAEAQTKKAPAKAAAPAATTAPAAVATPAATPAPAVAVAATEGNRTQIATDQLPAALQTTLTTDAYKDWKVANAYLVKAEKEYYEIEAIKGDEKAMLKFDKEGNAI